MVPYPNPRINSPQTTTNEICGLEQSPEIVAVISPIEVCGNDTEITQDQLLAIESSLPSNLVARTEACRQIGGFPTSPAFRGEASGEDCAFRNELKHYGKIARLSKAFFSYRYRPNSHLDFFLRRSRLFDGKIQYLNQSREEQDGSLARALHEYRIAARQREIQSLARRLAEAWEMTIFGALSRDAAPKHAANIGHFFHWILRHWPLKGEAGAFQEDSYATALSEVSAGSDRSFYWLRFDKSDSHKAKTIAKELSLLYLGPSASQDEPLGLLANHLRRRALVVFSGKAARRIRQQLAKRYSLQLVLANERITAFTKY